MMNSNDPVEVKDGRILVDHHPLPLRKGLVTAALARAGWKGGDGPIGEELFRRLLAVDRRIGIYAHPS